MKRIHILTLALLLGLVSGCRKPDPVVEGVTSYTLVSKINFAALGYGIDMTIYEYDQEGLRTDSNLVHQPEYQKEYTFYPDSAAVYLKLKLTSSENTVRWAGSVFRLEPGQNTRLVAGLGLLTDPNAYSLTEPTI